MVSNVGVLGVPDDGVALNEFLNTAVEGPLGTEASVEQALVGDDVIAFVRVFADGGFQVLKLGEVLLDDGAKLELGEVGFLEANVVGATFHGVKIIEGVNEDAGDVADVDVIALEVTLEDHDSAVVQGTVNEVVDEEVQSHARGHAENSGEAEAEGIVSLEDGFLGADLGLAIERDWVEGGILGAHLAGLTDTVPTVGDGHEELLGGIEEVTEGLDSTEVDRLGSGLVLVTKGGADDGGKGNYGVGFGEERL